MANAIGTDAAPRELFMTLLRRHRRAAGLDQTALAKRMGVTCSAVSLWEQGKSFPKAKYIPKLARILGMDAMALTRVIEPEDSARPALRSA